MFPPNDVPQGNTEPNAAGPKQESPQAAGANQNAGGATNIE